MNMEKTYKIKPLEFDYDMLLQSTKNGVQFINWIDTILGTYTIGNNIENKDFSRFFISFGFSLDFNDYNGESKHFDTVEECKDFIQSDYERRLLPALIEQ